MKTVEETTYQEGVGGRQDAVANSKMQTRKSQTHHAGYFMLGFRRNWISAEISVDNQSL